jgi:deferrochelatase/peroxidase EfeB
MVRASVLNMSQWDQEPLTAQQQAVGRWKYSGASLDNPNEPAHLMDPPAFAQNPTETAVPFNSHIRRSNPRAQPSDAFRRIFRRGYPLILPTSNGTLQRGLIFLAYGRSLSSQAEFIMRAWLKNKDFPEPNSGVDPILVLESVVVSGGYYFVPPVQAPDQPWNWQIPGV